jgi:hypothetical protein
MASQQQFQELIDNGQFDSISYFPKINPDEDFPINCSFAFKPFAFVWDVQSDNEKMSSIYNLCENEAIVANDAEELDYWRSPARIENKIGLEILKLSKILKIH